MFVEKIINEIIKQNVDLFGKNPIVEKIDVGFTNTIYSINDKYIIKICSNYKNEESFKREIEFYQNNENNSLIPKLYYSNVEKNNVPFCYEIIEKIKGVSLYNIWHLLNDEQREDVIKKLCESMKMIHSNHGDKYDWLNKFRDEFLKLYEKANEINIFSDEEKKVIEYALSKFHKYLDSNDFVLVHNDLHFDNIFYDNGKVKIIDFERSMYAPRDFELDIIYRMIRKPWKFASEETEQFINLSDYSNIMIYIKKYYLELFESPFLYQRLAIYDMVYFLKQLVKNPDIEELKNDVILAAKIVGLKDELFFENVSTPQELMDFMNINIEYGWVDNKNDLHINNLKGFRENYRISSLDEMINTGLGTCIEQAKMIKTFFDKMGIQNKVYCHRSYETEENFDKEVRMHCFVLFNYNNSWYHFEHSNKPKRGIHKYKTVEDAIKNITDGFEEKKDIRKLTEINFIPDGLTFCEFNNYVNEFDKIRKF